MRKIIITAETGSDINKLEAAALGIALVPMHVSMGDTDYDDGTFPAEKICCFYDETGVLPKTSGCSPTDFQKVFNKILTENPDAEILHLAYSAVTTVSYSSAQIAADNNLQISAVDTKHVSAGQRAVVLQALDFLKEHPSEDMENIINEISNISNRTKMCFIPSNLTYLRAGGRLSNAAYVGGSLLRLKPCIEILDGKLVATKKFRGNMVKVIPQLIEYYLSENHFNKKKIWLIRSPRFTDQLAHLAEKTLHSYGFDNIEWVHTGCVITTHGGPGAFGIVGVTEDE